MSTNAKDRLAAILAARRANNAKSAGGVPANTSASAGASRESPRPVQDDKAKPVPGSEPSKLSETLPEQSSTKEAPRKVTQVMAPGNEAHPLALKLWELEEAMDKKLPDRVLILKHIHDSLKADPAVVTLLTDEAIGIIVAGLTEHTNTTITAAPKRVTGKRSQPLSLDLLD